MSRVGTLTLAFDLADELANQTTMCFAFDKCSPDDKDSNDWEDPG